MGVVYKLKPEVVNFIIEKKRANPALGCRALALLAQEAFKIQISKSSVNSLIKNSGLSMPVGRRFKAKRGLIESSGLGVILLKAADCLTGITHQIANTIEKHLNIHESIGLMQVEQALYAPLFRHPLETIAFNSLLSILANQECPRENNALFLTELQGIIPTLPQLLQDIAESSKGIRCLKIELSGGTSFYLDAQMHTVWSSPQIPYQFSTTYYHIISYIKNRVQNKAPLILFMAPGYDVPTKEFFELVYQLCQQANKITSFYVYNDTLQEQAIASPGDTQNPVVIFGLWPWQYAGVRKVRTIAACRCLYLPELKKDFSLAPVKVELSSPDNTKAMVLNGGVLEINENMELELLILTNSSLDNISLDNVVRNYLTNWPNLKEKLQDFSRKVEFFAAKKEPGALSLEQELRFDLESVKNVDSLFCASLKFLDLYLRRHFFPAGYEDKDFAWTKEHFYALKLVLKQQTSYFSATFCPPKEYLFHTELNYLCCRLNEAGITFQDGKKLWFFVQSTR